MSVDISGSIRIEAKVAGQRRPVVEGWDLAVPAEESIPLRELIRRVVTEEVAAFRNRSESRRLTRVMTRREITADAAAGRVDPGGKEQPTREIDVCEEVSRACLAFEDGLYYVFVDDEQILSLDSPVKLRATGRVLFLRLVALAGG